jgi:hypothetical protein
VAGCCECGDEPSGSCATELVSYVTAYFSDRQPMAPGSFLSSKGVLNTRQHFNVRVY